MLGPNDDPRLSYYSALPPKEFEALRLWVGHAFPFQFQRDWLFDNSDFAITNKSRQIGMSYTSSALGVLWGAYKGELSTIISVGQDEADEVLEKCIRHTKILQGLGSECAKTRKMSTKEITFASGGRVKSLPSSGGRGYTGNVFLDEFAYQQHATKVWDATAPVALLGHKIRVISTPNGIGNEFHDLWEIATNPDRREAMALDGKALPWTPHMIPIELAIEQGYDVDITKCWALAKGDPRLFAQMFNCSFLDNVLQYIPNDVIATCLTGDGYPTTPTEGEFYAGLDIGREADLSCLVVIYRTGKVCFVVHVETMKRTDSDGLEAMVDRAFARYKLRRLCVDATGLGTFPADRIKKRHSERVDVPHRRPRVEPVVFTPTTKEEMATGLYAAMTGNQLRLPAGDAQLAKSSGIDTNTSPPSRYTINEAGTAKKLRTEIASVQRIVSRSGNVQYITPRTSEGHADRAWALMLALHARSTTNPMIDALRSRVGA